MWKSITQYHPRIGYTWIPQVRIRIPWEIGGYLLRTNSTGFRSEREFEKRSTAGKFRVILFGDSQTAGDGVSNRDRFSDVLEALVPNLEVYNYGLPGTGTDQHYLTYQEFGDVEHDLVIIGIHVNSISRVANRFYAFRDEADQEVVFAKPYFSLGADGLTLHHVPVPKLPTDQDAQLKLDSKYIDRGAPFEPLRRIVKKLGMRDWLQKFTRFQPVPAYNSPRNPDWLLLRAILETWIRASPAPVLLLPIPMWPFVEQSSDPRAYQARFRELARDTGCHLHDPLPDLWKYSVQERRGFRFAIDSHLTPCGHQALAHSLAPVVAKFMSQKDA